jgi:hypothetical protein
MLDALLHGWPFLGMVLAVFIVWRRIYGPAELCLLAYIAHQLEEHWIDFYGRPYHFHVFMCQQLGYDLISECPATPMFIFIVNVVGVWGMYVIAAAHGSRNAFLNVSSMSVVFVNAFAHIIPWARNQSYNPGAITSVVLFVPLSWWLLYRAKLSVSMKALALLVGVFVHVAMLSTLMLRVRTGSEAFLLLDLLLPLYPTLWTMMFGPK